MESVGSFTILERLGAGALGELFSARDGEHGLRVALRVVDAAIAGDPLARADLLADARQASLLQHPNVAALVDIVEDGESLCLVHEWAEGQALGELISGKTLGARLALDIARQVADGLAAAAELRLVHGALNPASIVVSADGQAKILDIGLSRWTRDGKSRSGASRALEGATVSDAEAAPSDAYMAPEQALGSTGDGRADVFALGAILHEMLTGESPFRAETASATAMKILQAQPPAPSALNPSVPAAADAIVQRATAKSLANRYPSAAMLAADLRELLPSLQAPAPPPPEPAAEPPASAEPPEAARPDDSSGPVEEPEPEPALAETVARSTSSHQTRRRPRVGRLAWAAIGAAAFLVILAAAAWFGRNAMGLPWRDAEEPAVRPTVVVMSFAVVGDQAPAYLGPGFAEDLAARLSEIPGATVVGRTAIRDSTSQSDWRARARRAGATFAVRGTLTPGPYSLNADVELVNLQTAATTWKQHFAREPREVSALQAEIAAAVAQRLQLVTPTSNRWARASLRRIDPAAYDLYLQGRDAAERRDRTRAIALFDQALERDPGLVEARASLSQALYLEEYYAGGMRDAATPRNALREAEAALAVDAELPGAHLAAALSAPTITAAASALARTLAYDPSNGEAWHHAGDLVSELDPPRSIPFYRASLALEPSIDANWRDIAAAFDAAGNQAEAEQAIASGEAARPDRRWWTQMRARIAIEQGRYDEALQLLGNDPSAESTPIVWLMGRVVPLALAGRLADARREAGRLSDRYPAFCEGRAVLGALEIDAGSGPRGRQLVDGILIDAARPGAEPPMTVCAALAAAGTGDAAEAASWLSRLAGDERSLRLWTRQATFGVGLSFRSRWYPWNKVLGSQPMQVASGQLQESLQRLRDEVERRLPSPPGATPAR